MLVGLERRRQEERKRAPVADRALDVDLAAEQPGDLAADRQPEADTAVTAARRSVGLLERLEDEPQLVVKDADTDVYDRELEHGIGPRECLACELPSFGDPDPQLDVS